MPFAHIQGAFEEWPVADAVQGAAADRLTGGKAALALALHASGQIRDQMAGFQMINCPR